MEETSNSGGGSMIKLNSSNYSIWKPKMLDILYCKDLYEPVEGDGTKPTETEEKDWKIINRKAVGLIRSWVDISQFHHVAEETNAHTLWKKLESMYERKSAQNKAFLIRKLVNLKYREGRPVAEHLNDF